ncbi:non-ribosomal peptide synthetase, partial [Paraflavitalea pollutisoli]|uniref:non-ribosomal peptide synthetase n=1 Tax=Paraflavitalea pollutisoli TaxID=3034143 RepID=UPI0023EDDAC7
MAIELYKKLQQLRIGLSVKGDSLDLKAPKGILNQELLAEIRDNKQALIGLIRSYTSQREQLSAIPAVTTNRYYPLSSSQKRLWVLSQFGEGNAAYNISRIVVFKGDLDMAALNHAFQQLVARHESLRTTFQFDEDGQIAQVISPGNSELFHIDQYDLRESGEEEAVQRLVQDACNQPFDLAHGPLLRAVLCQVAEEQWVFACVMHHIVSDGWSMNVMIGELMSVYNARMAGVPLREAPLRIHYKDYACWQQQQLQEGAFDVHRQYWLQQLSGELPVCELPVDHVRPALKTYNGGMIVRQLSADIYHRLVTYCRLQQGSLFMGLVAAVNALLYRYTGQHDLLIGSPIAGRDHADLEDQIGFFLNVLPLRNRIEPGDGYRHLFERVRQSTIDAYEHQSYPFDALLQALSLQRDKSRSPLFDVFIDLQTGGLSAGSGQAGALQVTPYEKLEHVISKFDLTFLFIEKDDGLTLLLEYNSDLFERPTAARIAFHFESLLLQLISQSEAPLAQLDYLGNAEQQQLLVEFAWGERDTMPFQPVVSLFEAQVALQPDRTVVRYEGVDLSYLDLHVQSDRLASYLADECRLGPGSPVGILLNRSAEMVIALLGILKAGCAYVPIDPAYPSGRIEYIVKDAGLIMVITETAYLFDLPYYEGRLFAIDVELTPLAAAKSDRTNKVVASDLAYVIYTSGSTGMPKGCAITQGGFSNYIQWANQYYFGAGRAAGFGLFTSLSFDLTVTSIFCALTTGGVLEVYEQEKDLESVLRHYFNAGIENIKLTPSHISLLKQLEIPASALQRAIVGGEQVTPEHVRILKSINPLMRVYNEYGPTETTVGCVVKELLEDEWVCIGRPIAQTAVYVLDSLQQLCPVGVAGELYIGGAGLARGYQNRPDLTADRFIDHPFLTGEKLYRSGDKARWLANGELECLGRTDEQVKVRGYRIEPSEIVAVLIAFEQVTEAAVLARPDEQGMLQLVAYVVSRYELDVTLLRQYLAQRLPSWMVPAHYVQLDKLPLNVNGKLDRQLLHDPAVHGLRGGAGYVAARTDAEEQLVAVCEAVLKKQPIGIGDDFFVLGGDSIKSIQVVSRLKQRGYSLTIQDVLQYPVLEELAGRMSLSGRSIGQEVVQGAVPLGPVQHWFFNNGSKAFAHYNQSMLLRSRGPLSEAGLRAALMELVKHHDALRMVFRATPQGWVQENLGLAQGYGFTVVTGATGDSFVSHCEEIQSGMDLQTGPLLKACLFRGEAEDRLLLVIHHLVTDGVSWRILLEDLEQLYVQHQAGEALTLPLKTDAFRDWQLQQGSYAQSEALLQEDQYWSSLSQHDFASLPVDREGGSNLQESIANCSFALTAEQTERFLLRCYKSYRTGPNEVLLTGLGLALKRVWGLNRVLVNLEGHGREDIGGGLDTSRTVGWFTSMYPVLLDMGRSADRLLQLIGVKEDLQAVPGRGIGYGILRYLRGRDYGLSPAINFNYLGDFGRGGSGDQVLVPSGEAHGRNIGGGWQRDCLLDITGITVGGQLGISISYSTGQYDAATMERLMTAYRQELEGLIDLLSDTAGEYLTPSDLGYKELSIGQCLALNTKGDLEDVYTLSPLQEGLYYQWLMWPQSGAYFEQMSYRVAGVVDIDLLGQSYQRLVARHAVLRTSFRHDLGNKPVQIVRKGVLGDFEYADRSGDNSFKVADWRSADRARGFNLQEGSQMRLQVVRVADGEYEFLWSHHHILMDGW